MNLLCTVFFNVLNSVSMMMFDRKQGTSSSASVHARLDRVRRRLKVGGSQDTSEAHSPEPPTSPVTQGSLVKSECFSFPLVSQISILFFIELLNSDNINSIEY